MIRPWCGTRYASLLWSSLVRPASPTPRIPPPHTHARSGLLRAQQASLASAAASGADPSEALERLVWLLRMAAHVLADSGAGETPLPPEAVLQAVAGPEAGGGGGAGVEAVVGLSHALLEVRDEVL